MKNLIKEFKDFAIKGNMIDMAVGIIIGTAFNKVVNSLVTKVIMPPLSLLTGDTNLQYKKIVLREAGGEVEEIAIGYGEFLEVMIDFGIIALTVFLVIKAMNKLRTKAEDPRSQEEITPKNIELLDQLKQLMEEQNEILRDSRNK